MIRSMISLIIFVITAYALLGETAGSRPIYTIKSEDGDVIDCYYIHEQPALAQPLLKNHKIQMRPTNSPVKKIGSSKLTAQTWQKSGKCPSGTVPILRNNLYQSSNFIMPNIFNAFTALGLNERQEEASGYTRSLSFYTATGGDLYIYNVTVEPNEFSLTYIAIGATNSNVKEAFPYQIPKYLSAGWMAYPSIFGDSRPRLFGLASNENKGGSTCLNNQCGFVQTKNTYALGAALSTISHIRTLIYIDNSTNNWWLSVMDEDVGYWPNVIIEGCTYGDMLKWGGLVLNTIAKGFHTSTTMGNGLLPCNDSSKAGKIEGIEYASEGDLYSGLQSLEKPDGTIVTFPGCYNYSYFTRPKTELVMFYGGSGGKYCSDVYQ